MASTTALYSSMSGLSAHARALDVIGNNVANVGTTAFKADRIEFSNMFSRTLSMGSAPRDDLGGTNPYQIGMGVAVSGVQKQFTGGTISASGNARDLAIDGEGFFVVTQGTNEFYTRDGSFTKNASDELVTIAGDRVMGFGVDENHTVIPGILEPISIPLGRDSIAEATSRVDMAGNLNAAGNLPSQGSLVNLSGTATTGLRLIATAIPVPGPGNVIESLNLLTDIEDPAQAGSNTPLFAVGQTLQFKSAEKGNKTLPTQTLAISATTTLADLMTFLNDSTGLQTTVGVNPDGRTPGVTLDATTGIVSIVGNTGTTNDLKIDASDLRLLAADGTYVRAPFAVDKDASADGEAVRTSFIVYDSLGSEVAVDVTMVAESRTNAGTTWRYYIESGDDTDNNLQLATGVVNFDTAGQMLTPLPVTIDIDREQSGAVTPVSFELNFASGNGAITALADTTSQIAATFRDGSPMGTLTGFGIGSDGVITGAYSNGQTRTLGQVAMATFANNQGLVSLGENKFGVGPNSGNARVLAPNTQGAGKIVAGSLELSNVDLSGEFIKMIQVSTGYSANSRVIRTVDELMQQLLVLGR